MTLMTDKPAIALPLYLSLLLAAISGMAPFAIDTYLPAIPEIADFMGTGIHRVEMSVSAFLLAFAGGQLIGGPLSDSYGRRPIILTGLVLFLIPSVLTIFVVDVSTLIGLRVVQGLGGGFSGVAIFAVIRDRVSGAAAAKTMNMVMMIMLVAPLVAPAVGAWLTTIVPWQGIFVMLTAYATILLVITFLAMPETRRRARRTTRRVIADAFVGYGQVLRHRVGLGYILASAMTVSVMFVFITESAFIYIETYQVAVTDFPYFFGANIVVMMLVTRLNGRLLNRYEPHAILYTGSMIQVVLAGMLAVAAWMQVDLVIFAPLMFLTIGVLGLIGTNSAACLLSYFPETSGTANAVLGAIRFVFGGIAGGLATVLHNGTLMPPTLLMAGLAVGALFTLRLLTTGHTRVSPENGLV